MTSTLVAVREQTDVAEARRVAKAIASGLSLDDSDVSNLAIVVTEAAKNLLKHAGSGEIILRPIGTDGFPGVELLAVDRGPGIDDVARSSRDGFSTAGTSGTGLGAIARMSQVHDIYSRPGEGTVLMAQVLKRGWAAQASEETRFTVGAICLPLPGETECGDDWQFQLQPQGARLTLVDGLGHGPAAAAAAGAAVRIVQDAPAITSLAVLERIHTGLRPTRGAAIAIAQIDPQKVGFTGLGNISGAIIPRAGPFRRMMTQSGIAGHEARRLTEFAYPWERNSLLLMHSDGLSSRWSVDRYPGLLVRHPSVIAGVLYRDYARTRDDVTVVVVNESGVR